jgi:hypothetical protein
MNIIWKVLKVLGYRRSIKKIVSPITKIVRELAEHEAEFNTEAAAHVEAAERAKAKAAVAEAEAKAAAAEREKYAAFA